MSKTINTRISQKHDFEINWNKAVNFKPNAGELIIYDAEVDGTGEPLVGAYELVNDTKMYPSNEKDASGKFLNNRTEPITTARIKVGDGIRFVNDLEFASSPDLLNPSDEFVFYCGDSDEIVADPYESAEYIIACGDADSVK
jgi:hypothetical protein